MVTNKMLLYAEDVQNIAIIGHGTIDGNGDHWVEGPYGFPSFSKRPRIIHLRGCENILIRDITLTNSASWVQSCKDLVIEGITVDSRENKNIEKERYADVPGRNTDGLDLVDCERVRVSNCFISSGDDAICLKSLSPDEACRDITITNCIVSSNASGIKIGTETSGCFEDITVTNCVVFDTRVDAISIMTVDGARMERIQFSNISCRNIKASAIFIRLGKRLRTYRQEAAHHTPHLKNILFENIQGTRISADRGCIIAGLEDAKVENLVLRNIHLEFEGGGTAEDARRLIPEEEASYPNGKIFGRIPAYGFFIRQVRNLTLDNIQLRTFRPDHRPAIFCDKVENLTLTKLQADASPYAEALVLLKNTQGVLIQGTQLPVPVNTLFRIQGKESKDILLAGNDFRNANNILSLAEEVSNDAAIIHNF
jgi:polygalacturonase